jgi:Zn-finger protein
MGGPDTFWLNFTNFALGLFTLELCLWVASGIGHEAVYRRRLRRAAATGLVLLVGFVLAPRPAGATVDMQSQAKKLGFAVKNCLDCHATPHAAEVMQKKAKNLKMLDGNCLACHGANIPAALNAKGEWLVAEKGRRGAKQCNMAWLRDYKEPAPAPQPATPKASTAKPAAPRP